jgi:hypothetical protein
MKLQLILSVILILATASMLSAQTATTGQIGGVVTDPSGAVITGASVKLDSQAGIHREGITDQNGGYLFNLLPPGYYSMQVTAPGFRNGSVKDIEVKITEAATVNVPLQIGNAGEVVNVSAEATLVQTTTPVLGRVIDERTLSELPLATRNYTQILGLSPGASTYLPDNTAVGRNSQNISVNGARVTNNNFIINGIDANSMGTNSAPSLGIPAPESLQEFKVQTSLYDATYGRSGGGNIQAITKSGADSFHGGLYEYFRNEKLNANNPFLKAAGVDRPELKRNVYGGMLGGPIKRDKIFFFGSYQGTQERNAASPINSLSSNILIAPGLTDDRSEQTLLRVFRPASATGVSATAINPTALALLNFKLPNGRYLIPTPQANGRFSGATPSSYEENQFNANVDIRFSDRNTLSGKLFFFNAPQTLTLPSFLGGGPNIPGFGNFQQNNGRLASLTHTYTFSPNIVNELRGGYNFLRVDAFPQEPLNDSDIGIKRVNANTFPGLPLIRVNPASGGFVTGTSPTIDVKAVSPSSTLADTLSIVHGKHTFRTGLEFRYNENNYNLNFFTRGQIDFLTFNDFLQGNTFVSVFGSGIGNRSLRAWDYNFFAQDDWKVSSHLSLNFGLRYELDLPPYDTRGRISTFDPGLYQPRPLSTGGVPIGPPIGGFVQAGNVIKQYEQAGVPKVDKQVVKSIDPNNFAPRFGFAYAPGNGDGFVVRGGYGIYYSRTSFQYVTLNVIAPPTYVFGARVGAPLSDPFFAAPPKSAFPTLVPGVALSGTLFDRNLRTPYIQQFNFDVQYSLRPDLLLEVGYVGSRGVNLFRQIAINQARLVTPQSPITNDVTGALITTNTAANASLRVPYSGVGINNFFQNQSTAQSVYHSLQASLTKRFAHGLQFLASYTFAKSIDNASGQGGGAGVGGVVNPGGVGETSAILGNQLNNRANRGPSDFDRTHRFVLSGLWTPPLPGSHGFARHLVKDWQIGGIVTAQTGLPIDIVDTGAGSFYGLSGAGAALARPNWATGATAAAAMQNIPAGYYFNPAAFVRPTIAAGQTIPSSGGAAIAGAAGTDIGNVGRNVLRGPKQINVDFALSKRFPIRESYSLELRGDAFNLLNQVNLANPLSDLNAGASFGRIISTTNNPRLVQFALKLQF